MERLLSHSKNLLFIALGLQLSGCLYFLRESVPCELNDSASSVFATSFSNTAIVPNFLGWRDEEAGEMIYVAYEVDENVQNNSIDVYSVNINSPSLTLLGSVPTEAGSTYGYLNGGTRGPDGSFYISMLEQNPSYVSGMIKVTPNGAVSKLVAGYQFQTREVQFTNPVYYQGKIYVSDREDSYDITPHGEKRMILFEIDPDSGAVALADDTFCFGCDTSKKVAPRRVMLDPTGNGILITGSAEDALDSMNLYVTRFIPGTGLTDLTGEVEAGLSENWYQTFSPGANGGGVGIIVLGTDRHFIDFGTNFSTFTPTLLTPPSGAWYGTMQFQKSILADEYLVQLGWKTGDIVDHRLGTLASPSGASIFPTKIIASETYDATSGTTASFSGDTNGSGGVVLESVYHGRIWSQTTTTFNFSVSASSSLQIFQQACQ